MGEGVEWGGVGEGVGPLLAVQKAAGRCLPLSLPSLFSQKNKDMKNKNKMYKVQIKLCCTSETNIILYVNYISIKHVNQILSYVCF